MYAFVHFLRVVNEESLVNSLCKIRIGNLHMHANIARYTRVAAKPKAAANKVTAPTVKAPGGSNTYANVVTGAPHVMSREKTNGLKKISIACDENNQSSFPFALIGCYKDFRAISNTRSMCQGEGFFEVKPFYLGGLWVLLDFPSVESRDLFIQHSGIKSWFSELKVWHADFVVKERLLWLEVEGVPLRAWNHSTFKQIASKWGDLIFVDDADVTNRFSMRLGIKTTHAPLVFESMYVNISDVDYCIRVRELSSWTPNFLSGFKDEEDRDSVNDNNSRDEENEDDSSVHSVPDTYANENNVPVHSVPDTYANENNVLVH
ncbi:hypothetical protein CTI12_AA420630 [Artemisia annua]|uniref:Uncharacterized protein n=1 Tax=Artemisia annua TaxID=35608 RepID=A0A2U1M4V0_ARTAN|nr:hypothetical protein CTI12_AA420630 [Artemisia annua]